MTEDEAKAMLEQLSKHYRCRVAPVSAFCDAFDQYFHAAGPYLEKGYPELWKQIPTLRLVISKSCLLDRLVYIGEPVRTEPCPTHRGHWSGLEADPPACCGQGSCGCTCGWLPVNKD